MSQITSGDTDEYGALSGLTQSDRLRLLADERRRLVLELLPNHAGVVELDELAADVVEREEANPADRERARRRAAIALHHKHLPLLDDHDVLDYEPATRLIRP